MVAMVSKSARIGDRVILMASLPVYMAIHTAREALGMHIEEAMRNKRITSVTHKTRTKGTIITHKKNMIQHGGRIRMEIRDR